MNKYISVSGKKIHYRVHGQGRPVILVHGFGETGDVWSNQVAFLEHNFRLIVPDLPGSGSSDNVDDMSIEGMAEIIKLIFNAEISPENTGTEGGSSSDSGRPEEQESLSMQASTKPALIGHSMGGYITLAFVEKYGEALSAFGLFHSSGFADNEEKKESRKKSIEFIKERGAFEFFKNSTPNLFSPQSKSEKAVLIDGFIRSLSNFSAQSLVSYTEAMMQRPDRTETLRTTTLPVLLILGEFDNAIPLQDGLRQAHIPEKSYIHILHQSGHMGMLEEVEKSNQILNKFLSET